VLTVVNYGPPQRPGLLSKLPAKERRPELHQMAQH
jgi:hypothetical protein